MTQPLIDERRNLNRMAQDELRAIKALIGDVGFARTQEIRKNISRIGRLIASYKELSKESSGEDNSYQKTLKSNFAKSASLLDLPPITEFDNNPEYIKVLEDKQLQLSGLIEVEFPEHATQVLDHYANYDRLSMQSDAIKINMNSAYGRSV